MQKLIDLNEGQLLERGMFPDLPNNQRELWKTGQNVLFRNRRAEKAPGWNIEHATAGTVLALSQAYAEGIRRVYWAEQASIGVWEYGNASQILAGAGGLGYWSLETWGTWLLATNDFDPPKVWKNLPAGGQMVNLAGVRRPRFRLIKKHRNHVLGYWGQSVDWSAASNVELWEPDTNNNAGGMFIRDLDSDIVAAQPLGQHFGIYSSDSMVLQRYIGDPLYFGFETAINGIGAVSDSGIIPVANKHYGMSRKGFFVTDGISFTYIDTPQINRWVYDQLNMDDLRRVVGLHDERQATVIWWFPCKDGVRRGAAFNYKNSSWAPLVQNVMAAVEQQVYDAPILGGESGWGFLGKSENAGDTVMETELETFPLDGTQREHYKQWDMYRADFAGNGLEVRFGFSDKPDMTPEWTPWEPLKYENFIHRESVYLRIGLRSHDENVGWRLSGFSVHGELGGYADGL